MLLYIAYEYNQSINSLNLKNEILKRLQWPYIPFRTLYFLISINE